MSYASIIKHSIKLDKLPAEQRKYVEVIEAFSSGDFLVHKENILSIQDTSQNNYPTLLKALIKDINMSSKLIIKSIIGIVNSNCSDDILVESLQLVSHNIKILKSDGKQDIIVSDTLHRQLKDYANYVKYAARNLLNYLLSSPFSSEYSQTVKHLVRLCDCTEESINTEFLTYYNAKSIDDELKMIDRSSCPSDIISYINLFTDQQGGKRSRFYYVYFSSNLYDEKIIPKKSFYAKIDVSSTKYNTNFDLIFNNGCNITNKRIKLYGNASIDYSIDFYLKRFILQKITGDDFFNFISVYKDFLTKEKDKYILKKQPSLLNEKHPFVADIKKDILIEEQIGKFINSYDNIYREVQKLTNYFERSIVTFNRETWDGIVKQKELLLIVEENGVKQNKYSSEEVLDRSKDWLYGEIIGIVSNSYSLQDNNSLRAQMQREYYIDKVLKKALDLCYEVRNNNERKDKISHWRTTTFHTVMASSYVFDFRDNKDGIFSPLVHEKLKDTEDKDFKEFVNVLKNNNYHDFYEFDKDIFSKHSVFDMEKLILFFKGSAALKLPIRQKIAFKARKLKNYLALGIYFHHTKTIGIDFRDNNDGSSSYIHEIAHHIDLNEYFSDRENIISALYNYFYLKIKKRKKYFLSDEELIARGAEIGKLLVSCNYKKYKEKHHAEPNKIIELMKEQYTNAHNNIYMYSWSSYSEKIEYVNIEELILKGDFFLLDMLYKYYLKFWNGKKSEQMGASLSSSEVSVSRAKNIIEMLYPKSHISYDYVQCDIYKISKEDFSLDDYILKYMSLIKEEILPSPSFSPEEIQIKINDIKKLWSTYVKKGDLVLSLKIQTLKESGELHFTHKIKNRIIKDFTNKFESDTGYSKKKESLLYVLNKVYEAI